MVTEVTQGIKVSVTTRFMEDYSNPENDYFIFSYQIRIENQNPFTVQLLNRHWEIWDSLSGKRIVDGEGVVGQLPILESGENYQYESACNLDSEIGSMKGIYTFKRLADGTQFEVAIPVFYLEVPVRAN
jgi:ApaG protein